jgi:hypothetical protein
LHHYPGPACASTVSIALLSAGQVSANDPPRPNGPISVGALSIASDVNAAVARRLRNAYPDHITDADGHKLIWRDGTQIPLDDGLGEKAVSTWIEAPDLKDIFRFPYPAGTPAQPPAHNADPGRARPAAFFNKMYGSCSEGEVARHLVDVPWLPSYGRQTVKATTINGVAQKLAAVSAELEKLPSELIVFLVPSAGAYNCRHIAGTTQASAHGYGIAIDIAVKNAHYWRWSGPKAAHAPEWRNAIPIEIVEIFEKHGFIWGGRWHHFDTMHFEYRPELLLP